MSAPALLAFPLFVAWGLGLAALALGWRAPVPALLRRALALGLGLAATSCGTFLWLAAGGGAHPDLLLPAEVALLALAGALAWRRAGRGAPPEEEAALGDAMGPLPSWALPAAVGLTGLAALLVFGFEAAWHPDGRWDAWMIWNQRARFLFRGGPGWAAAFTEHLAWSHPDYPLLVPASVARLWFEAGAESHLAPIALGGCFLVASAGVLVGALVALRGHPQAALGAVALLGTAPWVRHAAAQYADVPLGFFVLACVAALLVAHRAALLQPAAAAPLPSDPPRDPRAAASAPALPPEPTSLALAGLCAGFAAWTKNEGLLFALVATLAAAALALPGGRRAIARDLAWFALGAAPAALVVVAFKLGCATSNDLVAGQGAGSGPLGRLTDPHRYALILGSLAREGVRLPTLALLGAAVLLGPRPDWRAQRVPLVLLAALALVFLGYLAVYVLTPLDLEWHLDTSMRRLQLQLWPALLLLVFVLVRTPAEATAAPDATTAA